MKSPLCLLLLTTYSTMVIAAPPSVKGREQVRDLRDESIVETLQGNFGNAVHLAKPMIIEDVEGSAPHMQIDRTTRMDDVKTLQAMRPRTKEFNPASPTRLWDDLPVAADKKRMKRAPFKKSKGGYGGGSYGGGGGGCCGSCGGCGGGGGNSGSYSSSNASAQSSSQSGSYGGKRK